MYSNKPKTVMPTDNDERYAEAFEKYRHTKFDNSSRGVLCALEAKGGQDVYAKIGSIDMREKVLKNNAHQMMYAKLSTETTVGEYKRAAWLGNSDNGSETRYSLVNIEIKPSCDLINMVDLYTTCPLSDIHSISVSYGGQQFDKLWSPTHIRTQAALFGRHISEQNGLSIIPLAMAPLHKTNLVFPSTAFHTLTVTIVFKKAVLSERIELYGNMYFFKDYNKRMFDDIKPYEPDEDMKELWTFLKSHEFITFQSTYNGDDVLIKGMNNLKLSFNHPCCVLYFWGFDKSQVKNIRFLLNKEVFYDGPIDALEHDKASRGFGACEPVMIFLSDGFDTGNTTNLTTYPMSTVNFSRIDYETIEIETDEKNATIHFAAVNIQVVRHMERMYGLAFSK